jgi:hypothetical protein
MKFLLVQKVKGKVVGLAGIDDATCCADASDKFIAAGLPNEWKVPGVRVTWGDVESQKNYKGRAANFVTL